MTGTCCRPEPFGPNTQWIPLDPVVTTAPDSFFASFIAIALVLVGFMSGFVVALQMQPKEVECTFTVKDNVGNTHEWNKKCQIR